MAANDETRPTSTGDQAPTVVWASVEPGRTGALTAIGPFRLLDVLGEGGMGTVYRAEQAHPRRLVAIKVIKPGYFSPELLRRFDREAEVLGRLQHPGIAQIYEAGTAQLPHGPQPFFAMEYVADAKDLLAHAETARLDTAERLALMAQVCDAVEHAHQRGVVHRDLKPANILVAPDGQPKILDFGVARITDADVQATMGTDLGQLVGTLPYMSPEQVGGDPLALDTRSDVYTLGVILFELLAGRRPYPLGRQLTEAARIITEEEPPSLGSLDRAWRGDVEAIAARALEKDKTARYQSAAALAADLRRFLAHEPIEARPLTSVYRLRKFTRRRAGLVAGAAAAIGSLLLGLATAWLTADPIVPLPIDSGDATQVAVLPLEPEDGAPEKEALGRALADVLISRIETIPGVSAVEVGRNELPDTDDPVSALARAIGVDVVLDGRFAGEGDALSADVTLVLPDGSAPWVTRYEMPLLGLPGQVSLDVAGALGRTLTTQDRERLTRPVTTNVTVFDDYAAARELMPSRDTPGSLDRAIELLESVVKRDPNFGIAHGMRGELYWSAYGIDGDEVAEEQAQESLLEAMRLDPEDPEVRVQLALIYADTGRLEAALDELSRVIESHPAKDWAYRLRARILIERGEIEQARADVERAVELRPNLGASYDWLGFFYSSAGQYPEAIAAFTRGVELEPDSPDMVANLGDAYLRNGDRDLALQALSRSIELGPNSRAYMSLGMLHRSEGRMT